VALVRDALDDQADLVGVGDQDEPQSSTTDPDEDVARVRPAHLAQGGPPIGDPILDRVLVTGRSRQLGQGLDQREERIVVRIANHAHAHVV